MKKIIFIGLLPLLLHTALFAEMHSAYSKIDQKSCKEMHTYMKGYESSLFCGKYAGIGIELQEIDLRQNLILLRKGKHYDLAFPQKVSTSFSRFGTTIEWRMPEGKRSIPSALIIRYIVTEPDSKGYNQEKHYLVVAKITTKNMCIVGWIEPSDKQNIKAREMADRASQLSCLEDRKY